MRLIKLFCVLFILFYVSMASAAITFTDGRWSNTFDCTDVSQPNSPVACGGITWGSNSTFYVVKLSDGSTNNWTQSSGAENEWYYSGTPIAGVAYAKELLVNNIRQTNGSITYTGIVGSLISGLAAWGDGDSLGYNTWYVYQTSDPDAQADGYIYALMARTSYQSGDYVSSITSEANNSGGLGGKGLRTIDGTGITMDSSPIAVTFPAHQKEIWVRWYQKFESGYNWYTISSGAYPYSQKSLYVFCDTQGTASIVGFYGREYKIEAQNSPVSSPVATTGEAGWPVVMGVDPDTGGGADGLYHCYEVHLKMDTNGLNGIGRIWIDGLLVAENTAVDWSGNNNTAQEIIDAQKGWTYFLLGSNQGIANLTGRTMSVDFDDIVIYNTTPPNLDSEGNAFIGLIDTTPATLTNTTASLFLCTSDPRDISLTLSSSEPATLKFDTTDKAYADMTGTMSTTGGTSHSQTVSKSCGASYTYYVRSSDASGNVNTASTVVTFEVLAAADSSMPIVIKSTGTPMVSKPTGTPLTIKN